MHLASLHAHLHVRMRMCLHVEVISTLGRVGHDPLIYHKPPFSFAPLFRTCPQLETGVLAHHPTFSSTGMGTTFPKQMLQQMFQQMSLPDSHPVTHQEADCSHQCLTFPMEGPIVGAVPAALLLLPQLLCHCWTNAPCAHLSQAVTHAGSPARPHPAAPSAAPARPRRPYRPVPQRPRYCRYCAVSCCWWERVRWRARRRHAGGSMFLSGPLAAHPQ